MTGEVSNGFSVSRMWRENNRDRQVGPKLSSVTRLIMGRAKHNAYWYLESCENLSCLLRQNAIFEFIARDVRHRRRRK